MDPTFYVFGHLYNVFVSKTSYFHFGDPTKAKKLGVAHSMNANEHRYTFHIRV